MGTNEILVLFRDDRDTEEELKICKKYFKTTRFRTDIQKGDLVIGRYSVLPWYKELEEEILYRGAKLINTYEQHRYIANFDWYHDIEQFTPKTYFNCGYATAPDSEHGWVVKGRTNSQKHLWDKRMYAPDRNTLKDIYSLALDDEFIGRQGIVIREYVPLETFEVAINGLPVANEWRVFVYKKDIITIGYYWSFAEKAEEHNNQTIDAEMISLIRKVKDIIGDKVNAYVIDVAKTKDGKWIVIEINDLQMSGLSMCEPSLFYGNLAEMVR